MDVKTDEFFNEPTQNQPPMSEPTEVKLPFPQGDYNKQGKLKRVRGRMLKKLLKCEIKHYLPLMICIISALIISSIGWGLCIRATDGIPDETENPLWFLEFSFGFLFIVSLSGSAIFALSYPVTRYNKNFFQDEGYLTFSVPASAEEHVLAKHLGAIICNLIISVAVLISVGCLIATIGGMSALGNTIGEIFKFKSAHLLFLSIEVGISAAVGVCMIPTVFGIGSCLFSKQSGKKKTIRVILTVALAYVLIQSSTIFGLMNGVFFPKTATGLHIMIWLWIFFLAGITVGCYFWEVWYLKHKLDLK